MIPRSRAELDQAPSDYLNTQVSHQRIGSATLQFAAIEVMREADSRRKAGHAARYDFTFWMGRKHGSYYPMKSGSETKPPLPLQHKIEQWIIANPLPDSPIQGAPDCFLDGSSAQRSALGAPRSSHCGRKAHDSVLLLRMQLQH